MEKKKISDAEVERRRKIVDDSLISVQLEGLEVTERHQFNLNRYINGEIDHVELQEITARENVWYS